MKNIIPPFNWHDELEKVEVNSIDDDFIMIDNPIITPALDYPFKADITIAVIGIKGTMKGSTNLKSYYLKTPCLYIILPGQIIQYEYLSDDFSGLFIVMSKQFLDNLLINAQERVPLFISIQNNPWIPLSEEDLESMKDYYNLLKKTIKIKENPYRLEVVKHLTRAFFYGSSYQFHKVLNNNQKTKKEVLLEKFLNYAQENYKKQRNLEFYAERLCLTPKYLSKVIKENSGSSASEWIDNYVILEAKALLRSTNMNIQQISEELNFPSQSFFGKYFKKHVGVSPQKYKNITPKPLQDILDINNLNVNKLN